MLKTKSVFSMIEPQEDGLRILAARFRGRGLPTSRYDVWMANLGPSEKLLKAMLAGRMSWPEFTRRYRAEMFENQPLDRGNASIRNHGQKFTLRLLKEISRRQNVTLMCHCSEDEEHCHRHILKRLVLDA